MNQRHKKRNRDWIVEIIGLLASFAGICYIVWLFFHINKAIIIFSIPFLFFECLNFLYALNSIYEIKKARLPTNYKNFSPDFYPNVDIFITVCGEPIKIVKETIFAALNIEYKNKKIYVLDDYGNKTLEQFCNELSITYSHEKSNKDFKAGNLNNGLKISSADFILTLDADQIARPEIIKSLIPYFENSKIGFISTAQKFLLPKNDPWGNADLYFYHIMQRSKAQDNAAISCGSGVIYRRIALDTIGGFRKKVLIEDLYTSMQLQAKKWKSIYLDTSYTVGLAPNDIVTQKKQRYQWAMDALSIFFFENPIFNKNLSISQRLHYFQFGFHYLIFGISLPFIFLVPVISIFSGFSVININFLHYLFFRIPYSILLILFKKVAGRGYSSFKAFQMQGGLFPVYFKAVLRSLFIKTKKVNYHVTKKTTQEVSFLKRTQEILVCTLFLLLEILAIAYLLLSPSQDLWFNIINIFWAGWVIVVLSRIVFLSFFNKTNVLT